MTDVAIRLAAGLAAVAIVAAPAIVAGCRQARSWLGSLKPQGPSPTPEVGLVEMRIVLDLANKMRASGMNDGVALCQQLLDVMLAHKGQP